MGIKNFFRSKRSRNNREVEFADSFTADYLNSPSSMGPGSPPLSPEPNHSNVIVEESYDIENSTKPTGLNLQSQSQSQFHSKTRSKLMPPKTPPTSSAMDSRDPVKNGDGGERMTDIDNLDDLDGDYQLFIDGKPVYVVKQKKGYLSILFSTAQTIILIAMMVQCGIAPMSINPMIGPAPDALSYWGGKNAYNILYDHEYWRLFSPIMLHAGLFHLLCNVSVQLDTGAFFEREWGSAIWLTVYLGSAASGSILSVIVSPNTIGVGSSGSVCGLFGAKLAEALCRSRESTKNADKELSHAILCEQFGSTLCSVILILVFSFIPYVDWAAHVGGLLGGFAVGLMIFALQIKSWNWRIMMFLFGFMICALGFGLSVVHMVEETKDGVAQEMADVCGYYMNYFPDYQCNCMLEQNQEE